MTQVPRIVVVDDHSLFRAGVIAELGDRVQLVGEAADVDEAVALIGNTQPEVVLLDVHLPGGGGAAVIERSAAPNVRFLAVSVSDSPEDVIGLVRAGARGYVTKSIAAEDLAEAVVRVAEGDAFFSPRLAGFVLDAFGAAPAPPGLVGSSELDQRSAREREVMRVLARVYSYKRIAAQLNNTVITVGTDAPWAGPNSKWSSGHR